MLILPLLRHCKIKNSREVIEDILTLLFQILETMTDVLFSARHGRRRFYRRVPATNGRILEISTDTIDKMLILGYLEIIDISFRRQKSEF